MNNFSTEPTRKILDRLGSPDKKLKIIHIAGTNGKGSTAQFFTQISLAAGKTIGTFTSPEVYYFNDQFKINGKPFSDGQIEEYFGRARAAARGVDASEFEIQTAGAIYAFAREGCEWAVIECGMGGLTDATNAITQKQLAVITSISLEHTAYLGDTVEKICEQKAGIIKSCPVVVNARQTDEAKRYFKSLGAIFADKLSDCAGNTFKYDGKPFKLSAEGILQPYNAATAIEGARLLGFDESAIYAGIENTKPEGRLEIINSGGRTYILDGAHNPAAFEQLCALLKKYQSKDTTVIFGCLSDKDIDGNLKALEGLAGQTIAVRCPSPRATDLQTTQTACRKYFKNVQSAKSVAQALDTANTQTVAVCGSFTLLKPAKEYIEKNLLNRGNRRAQ